MTLEIETPSSHQDIDKIVGIYSFPKSGNTWVRQILGGALSSQPFDFTVPDIYTHPIWNNPIDIGGEKTILYKSHSKYDVSNAYGRDFVNDLVVYIIRHPLDVFLSQLNYVSENVTSSKAINIPCKSVEQVISDDNLDLFFSAFCVYGSLTPSFVDAGSWFDNTVWWHRRMQENPDRVIFLRYEDLVNDQNILYDVFERLGLSNEQFVNGLELAKKRTKKDGKFYWKKQSGLHKELLPEHMIDRFMNLHRNTLETLGYH